MSNERDELARQIFKADNWMQVDPDSDADWKELNRSLQAGKTYAHRIADGLIAAGYRKPRTITTLEELKTVYEGAILKDAEGEMWGIDGSTGRLFLVGDGNYDLYDDDDLHLPATVVYEELEASK